MNYNIDIADIGLESQQILYYLENGHPASGALTHELCAILGTQSLYILRHD